MRALMWTAVLGTTMVVGTAPAAAAEAAQVRVTLPADATLTINGQPTQSASETRWFVTPPLENGRSYYYNFVAKFVRDGQTITVERKVPVSAGRQTVVSLGVSGSSAAIVNQNYYYNPQAPANPTSGANNYYYNPGYYNPGYYAPPSYGSYGSGWQHRSEWEPGNYKTYNP